MTGGTGPDLDWAPRRRDDVITVELDAEAVLYDPLSGNLHKLNTVGTVLWQCLDGTVTLRRLAGEVAAEVGLAELGVQDQLVDYVARLVDLGLLEGSD